MSCSFFFFQAEDGIRDGRVTGVQTCALPIWGEIQGTAMVTKRLYPLNVDGKQIWQIGFPIHWGFAGDPGHTGPLANTLTPSAMDPNTWTPEYKAFLVKLEKA